MGQTDIDVDSLTDDGLWEPQREIQHIYEEKIENAENSIDMGVGEHVTLSLTRDEFDKLCSFIEMFAYN